MSGPAAAGVDGGTPAPGGVGVAEARARLRELAPAPAVGIERAALGDALGRVLAAALASPRDVPGFDNVAVDGFAFRGADLPGASGGRLRLISGRAAAGRPFAGSIGPGEAVAANTGAPMPAGADTVAMWEAAEVEAGGAAVRLPGGLRPGANRRRAGEDVRRGQELFAPGLRLGPHHLGVAAELGLAGLPVFGRLRVALLSSGDELREPDGGELPPGGVFDANRAILRGLLRALPVEVLDLGILPDDRARTARALEGAAAGCDLILASGGASKGEADHVAAAVAEQGALAFWQIRMKPGRPLAVGRLGGVPFVGLPGNPVAATVCFLLFARPLILALAGAARIEPRAFPVPAAFAMAKRAGRTELLRAALVTDAAGRPAARRIEREGSGILTSLTDADGLVELGEDVTRVEPGDPVPFLSFAELGTAW